MTDPDHHWWAYGDYTKGDCPNCGRERLLSCTDNAGNDRIICEKCSWEPSKSDYCYDALGH